MACSLPCARPRSWKRSAGPAGARVAHLTALLGVSDMTVRRDLETLDRKGLLSKVHGGATAMDTASAIEPGFEVTSQREISEKEAIAARAAAAGPARHGDRDHRGQHHLDAGPAPRATSPT